MAQTLATLFTGAGGTAGGVTAGQAASSLGTLGSQTAAAGLGGTGSLGINFGAATMPTITGAAPTIPATTGITAGVAPSAVGGGTNWLGKMMGGGEGGYGDYISKGTNAMQAMKPAPAAPAQVNPNAGMGGQRQNPEDQMNAILESLLGLRR